VDATHPARRYGESSYHYYWILRNSRVVAQVVFMNVYEKYLSVDEVAGGKLSLRADSEEVGFGERFWVKIQNKYKREAHEEEKKKKMEAHVIEPDMDEAATKSVKYPSVPRFFSILTFVAAGHTKPGVLGVQ
jgi:hypothetical protein